MTDNFYAKKTLVCLLAINKEKEMDMYERKILKLRKLRIENPNDSLNEHKYNLVKMRYDQLKRTTKDLRLLKQEIENIQDNLNRLDILFENH